MTLARVGTEAGPDLDRVSRNRARGDTAGASTLPAACAEREDLESLQKREPPVLSSRRRCTTEK